MSEFRPEEGIFELGDVRIAVIAARSMNNRGRYVAPPTARQCKMRLLRCRNGRTATAVKGKGTTRI